MYQIWCNFGKNDVKAESTITIGISIIQYEGQKPLVGMDNPCWRLSAPAADLNVFSFHYPPPGPKAAGEEKNINAICINLYFFAS
ncbi:MAG: hypothetical protein ABIT81_04390 [Ferruginibacter sp.]